MKRPNPYITDKERQKIIILPPKNSKNHKTSVKHPTEKNIKIDKIDELIIVFDHLHGEIIDHICYLDNNDKKENIITSFKTRFYLSMVNKRQYFIFKLTYTDTYISNRFLNLLPNDVISFNKYNKPFYNDLLYLLKEIASLGDRFLNLLLQHITPYHKEIFVKKLSKNIKKMRYTDKYNLTRPLEYIKENLILLTEMDKIKLFLYAKKCNESTDVSVVIKDVNDTTKLKDMYVYHHDDNSNKMLRGLYITELISDEKIDLSLLKPLKIPLNYNNNKVYEIKDLDKYPSFFNNKTIQDIDTDIFILDRLKKKLDIMTNFRKLVVLSYNKLKSIKNKENNIKRQQALKEARLRKENEKKKMTAGIIKNEKKKVTDIIKRSKI